MDKPTNLIKVNLPSTLDSYFSGNGEGCWCYIDEIIEDAVNRNEIGTRYKCILNNDSLYYPGLIAGEEIPIELRGENRPVCDYDWLVINYGESWWGKATDEERVNFMCERFK